MTPGIHGLEENNWITTAEELWDTLKILFFLVDILKYKILFFFIDILKYEHSCLIARGDISARCQMYPRYFIL